MKVLAVIGTILLCLAILALAMWIRYSMADGNWSCIWSADPSLCNTVSKIQLPTR